MNTFTQIKVELSKLTKADLEPLAEKSGIPFHTLLKIWNGYTTDPRISTVEKLAQFLKN